MRGKLARVASAGGDSQRFFRPVLLVGNRATPRSTSIQSHSKLKISVRRAPVNNSNRTVATTRQSSFAADSAVPRRAISSGDTSRSRPCSGNRVTCLQGLEPSGRKPTVSHHDSADDRTATARFAADGFADMLACSRATSDLLTSTTFFVPNMVLMCWRKTCS
jgi:hypothetical protein